MKSGTPTWAVIVAIFMMLIGGCGIKNDIQSINIRTLLSKKDEIFEKSRVEIEKNIKSDTVDNTTVVADSLGSEVDSLAEKEIRNAEKSIDSFKKMMDIPEPLINQIIMLGYIGLFFSILLVLAGLFLILKKSWSIKFAYAALILTMLFSIAKWVMLSGEGSTLITLSTGLSAAFTLVLCTVLLIVTFSSDKSYLEDEMPEI